MNEGSTSPVYDAAVTYVKRGWAVIPLHGVRGENADRCTCSALPCGNGNRNSGKHPVELGWQLSGRFSIADCYTVWMECQPWANVGIVTGEISGIFVLDIDPDNGGDKSLEELIRQYGQLPATYTVRTGSGGHHFYFRMPAFPVTNKSKMLPDGIDVRGNGGQVVAPPSVSGKGGYEVVADVPVVDAPAWLLDLLKAPAGVDVGETVMVSDLPVYSDLDEEEQYRYSRYADRVIDKECEAYATWKAGDGSYRLFLACCNLIEIAQSPWNLITKDDVLMRLDVARKKRISAHPRSGGQSEEELLKTFQSAAARVVGKGRDVPPDPHAGVLFDVPMQLRSPAPTGSMGMGGGGGEGAALTASGSPLTSSVTAEQVAPYDAAMELERLAQRETLLLQAREIAKRRAQSSTVINEQEQAVAVENLLAKMLTPMDLEDLANPTPLVVDLLDLESESWIIGEPGGFKSFVALDIAGHVGTGQPWRGKKVTQGPVVYVVAEGAKGIKLRVKAWMDTYGPMENVRFLPEPVQVADAAAWGVLVEACRRIKPVMIVLDTQARITVGLDENGAKDIGVLTEAVRKLKAATGACVLVVHHIGRNGGNARGSSALDGAQDTEIRVERPTGKERKDLTATISVDKQKDGSEDPEFKIEMMVHDFGTDPMTGRPLTSLSIKPQDPFYQPPAPPKPEWEEFATENQALVIKVLRDHSDADGATRAQIIRWAADHRRSAGNPPLKDASIDSATRDLKAKDALIKDGARYILKEYLDE